MKTAPPICLLAALLLAPSCGQQEHVPTELAQAPGFQKRIFFLEAPCTITVEGIGEVDVEEEYIPGVVACENGNAPEEALKAQAVQARSFLYYKIFVAGQTTIRNSTADQVFSCTSRLPNGPLQKHKDAAAATRGQYLEWENSVVAAFYVAAAIPPDPDPMDPWNSCMPNGGNDPTNTQRWVTYNRGQTGCDVTLTDLGFVPADCRGNPHNRGCASQNGETCLANAGVLYPEMLKYYYGDDIVLAVADGRCGAEPVSAEDQFCIDNGDGAHCMDAASRIECAASAASLTETCDEGCGEGACLTAPEPTFCTGKADTDYCDGGQSVTCAAGEVSATEACPDSCLDGACANGDGGNNDGSGGGANNGGAPVDGDDSGRDDDFSVPPVIGPSPGVEGGCATTHSSNSFAWMLLLAAAGLRRIRR